MKFNLTDEQRRAVETKAKNVVVLANPGSGKTALLVERIHHLVTKMNVPPDEIMALTFTSKAATELRERVYKRIGTRTRGMWIRTFHSAGLQLIKTFPSIVGLEDNFTILDSSERRKLIREFVLTQQQHRYIAEDELVEEIGKLKNGMVLTKDLPTDMKKAIELYELVLKEQNAVDLDDMVVKAITVLKHPNVQSQVHRRFKHILIDEYQDINSMQERMIRAMLGEQSSSFLVGDPDQTIYEWRGAKPKYMMEHGKNAKLIQLTQNFRSAIPVVKLANHIIEQNGNRKRKPMEATGDDIYIPMVGKFESEDAQAEFVATKIKEVVAEKRFHYEDIAILVRNHNQTPALELALSKADIPYGGELFWSQPAVSSAFRLLECIVQPYINGNLAKAINLPTKIMSNLLLQDLAKEYEIQHLSTVDQLLVLSHLPGKWPYHEVFRQRLNSLFALHGESKSRPGSIIISQLIDDFNLKEESDAKPHELSVLKAIRGLLDIVLSLTTKEPNLLLKSLLLTLKRQRKEALLASTHGGNVQILTCHHSKGLEFPVVFVVGVQLGIFPNDFFVETVEDLEAERRLFYVAVTRAKQALFLTAYDDPEHQPVKRDFPLLSFLDKLPAGLIQEVY